ncbi:MAG: twin-arginine translocase TatA/TatE family subunit [Candidatus Omnitrophica bacterium]|nr:twin-arginine translocase TatA/TatE family subunit [Candidatus Omnitrophota bacterium]
MNIFNLGPLELAIIAIVALVVVGPRQLPELGRMVGR